ncbi:MAG: ABC transporter substrate-binding protein [Clostridiales bacterium]|mgnify:CR=1 FL=1|nr:ABC transporter substrate-binding protein [Clostridiales bacterium]
MKKTIILIITVCILAAVLTGCASPAGPSKEEDKTVKTVIRLGGLKGATTIGMVKLLEDNENGTTANDYKFTMAVTADELTPGLLKGELDILAVPANLGSIIYNNSQGAVQLMAVNTLGVIYIVEKGVDSVKTWEDLRGKTIYATGKGSTPEFVFTHLLAKNGIDAQTETDIQWKSEPSEIVALMGTRENLIAMMPQPFVTVAGTQFPDLRIALDLTEEWSLREEDSMLVTAGLIVRRDFAEEHPDAVADFLAEYAESTEYVNSNLPEAAALVEKFDIVKAAIAEKAIPYCNIVCITGNEMKNAVQGYYEVLYGQNPASIGGALPGDDFYYEE